MVRYKNTGLSYEVFLQVKKIDRGLVLHFYETGSGKKEPLKLGWLISALPRTFKTHEDAVPTYTS